MSKVMIDDESSRLKHFTWEQLDENFFIAVIFRSGRRYFVQRHFEQQLFDIKSTIIQNKWRRCLLEVISNSLSPTYITSHEVQLMHEIFSWHLNYGNHFTKLRENIDYMIDLEDLIDCFDCVSSDNNNKNNNNSFIIQPVTTLDAATKNIEMWKNLQENINEKDSNQTIGKQVKRKRSPTPTFSTNITIKSCLPLEQSSSTSWIQLDSKLVPFIKKQCDHLLPVEYLLKEHVISSAEDFSLRPLYIPINQEDMNTFNILFRQLSSLNFQLTKYSSLITLDHLIFRLKRLFFIRFIPSPTNIDYIDYNQVMSCNGGIITLINHKKQHIPFIYINKQTYIPNIKPLNFSLTSTFCMANKYELEYLRLIVLYDYLSSDESSDIFVNLLSIHSLQLIPVDCYAEETFISKVSLNNFHYHEYQRRFQQQKSLTCFQDNQQSSSGWWQPPVSSSKQRPLSNFKLQRPILF